MPVRYKPESGKLVRYSLSSTEVLSPWPDPRGWSKEMDDKSWRHVRPSIRLPAGDIDELISRQQTRVTGPMPPSIFTEEAIAVERRRREDHLNFLYWAKHVPADLRHSLSKFPDRQWHLLSMVARCGSAAHDLVKTNPALAYALASSWVFRQNPVCQPMRSIRALLGQRRKQREILAWLGFPNSQAVRRIMSRIEPKTCRIQRLLYLRAGLQDPSIVKKLSHLQRINASVLRIVTDPDLTERVRFSVLDQLSRNRSQDQAPRLAWILRDIVRMSEALDVTLPTISHYKDIEKIHDDLIDEIPEGLDALSNILGDVPFPEPPVNGDGNITPVSTPDMLLEEGREQQHCVWSYGSAIAIQKNTYIYRIHQPERATIELVKDAAGWKIGQIKGFRNREVSVDTRHSVRQWLDSEIQKNHATLRK